MHISLDMSIRQALAAGWTVVPMRRRHFDLVAASLDTADPTAPNGCDLRDALRQLRIMAWQPEDLRIREGRYEGFRVIVSGDRRVAGGTVVTIKRHPDETNWPWPTIDTWEENIENVTF